MGIDNEKDKIRKAVKLEKSKLNNQQACDKSLEIFRLIIGLQEFENAKSIFAYWSLPDEVYTHDFLERYKNERTLLLPVIDGNNICLKRYTGKENMQKESRFGIYEPIGQVYTGSIDMAIIPGVAFDSDNNRLGRGKAFYDKFLSETDCYKVGVGFDFQLFPSIPVGPHDVPMDKVICA